MTARTRDRATIAKYNRAYYERRIARDPGYLERKSASNRRYRKDGALPKPVRKLCVINRTTKGRMWRRPRCATLGPIPMLWGFPREWVIR
jgi:hypothetical protein